jgi:hypothetical protein
MTDERGGSSAHLDSLSPVSEVVKGDPWLLLDKVIRHKPVTATFVNLVSHRPVTDRPPETQESLSVTGLCCFFIPGAPSAPLRSINIHNSYITHT